MILKKTGSETEPVPPRSTIRIMSRICLSEQCCPRSSSTSCSLCGGGGVGRGGVCETLGDGLWAVAGRGFGALGLGEARLVFEEGRSEVCFRCGCDGGKEGGRRERDGDREKV